ncbi:DUF427 domain-containing protein [Arthrobacter sp. ok362]|jgi:uncharacterized protein (DUF427 family)|uniref:DUF427 domain-containing protein n=1 Tax=Arthrobacter sp. ok362 TaxID=1761745 RepID=UPI00087FF38A|nr:DUF427 domain-containing protein [Arthrobacter sp. ok362]SDK65672.1 Uncharacterized conserved protein, DUF427 family [Arthrobacter sp. ok362]
MATRLSRVLFGAFPQLRYEPTAKRIRARIAGHTVVDTLNAYLIWEPRRITPVFAVPENELHAELVPPSLPAPAVEEHAAIIRQDVPPGFDPRTSFHKHTAPGEELDVVAPGAAASRAAFRPDDPDLAGYVVLEFDSFDWLEDDEEIIGHPRDPFHRVDIRASSVPVEVALDGVTLASTNRAALLYETMLPVRYYIPPADVRLDLMEESPKRTVCPYKGRASYHTYPGSERGRNIAWSYDHPFRDAAQIHGLVSFFNERVDLTVGGVLQPRPVTPWSTRPD